MKGKRVLVLSFAYGSGHYIAGVGIRQAIEEMHPEWEVYHLDGILESHRKLDRITADIYLWFSRKGHLHWKLLYENPLTRSRAMKLIMRLSLNREILEKIHRFRPHAILSTHFLSHQYAHVLKKKYGMQFKHYMVITDYVVHPIWIAEPTDLYFLPSRWSSETVRGLKKFAITGIPLRKQFWNPPDRETSRRYLGLDDGKPILFLNMGTHGVMPLRDAVELVRKWRNRFRFLVVAGRNESTFSAFRSMLERGEMEGKVYSFTEDIHHLMAASSLVITKAGGLTVAEMLAVGRAGIYYRSMPGQEEGNVKFVKEHGAGFEARNPGQLDSLLQELTSHPERVERAGENARKLGRPRAALEIVKHVSHETD